MNSTLGQRGLSLVELMVGMAIGLGLLATASQWTLMQHRQQHRLAIERRMGQELRAAADVMARDVQRAGFWLGHAQAAAVVPAPNPYQAVQASTGLSYHYARDQGSDNQRINDTGPNERFGFELRQGVVRSHVGGAWQDLTDPSALTVTQWDVSVLEQEQSLGAACAGHVDALDVVHTACCQPDRVDPTRCAPSRRQRRWTLGSDTLVDGPDAPSLVPPAQTLITTQCPVRLQRVVLLSLQAVGPSPHSDLQRQWQQQVPLRNDALEGLQCP